MYSYGWFVGLGCVHHSDYCWWWNGNGILSNSSPVHTMPSSAKLTNRQTTNWPTDRLTNHRAARPASFFSYKFVEIFKYNLFNFIFFYIFRKSLIVCSYTIIYNSSWSSSTWHYLHNFGWNSINVCFAFAYEAATCVVRDNWIMILFTFSYFLRSFVRPKLYCHFIKIQI